ncbi:hypothetical protein [Vibrio sp. SCSIO 43136]|uniref:hypothetical protein n=1 Tax=Vibrio sp. SCSIO 43136 TaxID=2819101 RepID=UPI0020765A8E|nr:hypothetical protein [Vibrio sp. SCSIO 43136]USD64006.1 hypothetical protein J4N39_07665 [Vibrio sp. SCSIO 43136]
MRNVIVLPATFCTLWASISAAQIPGLTPQKNYDLNGYVKYMATANIPKNSTTSYDHLIHQRFNFEYRFSPEFQVNLGMRNRLIWGESSRHPGYAYLVGLDQGYMDLTTHWYDNDGVLGTTQFDRAYVQWQNQDWRLRAGRSRINWAMTTIWNPNDIFNSFSIYDFDYEERSGSDSIAISRSLDFASQWDLVYSPNRDTDLDSYAGRYLLNHQGWDAQIIVGKSLLDQVVGFGLAGDRYGAGIRMEASYFKPTRDEWNGVPQQASTVASLETDYSFGGNRNWLGRLAYLHISNPIEAESAIAYVNLPLSAKTLSFTTHTFYADLGFDVTPLWRTTVSTIYYQDHSWFASLNSTYSLSDNLQLIGVLQRFDGSSDSLFGNSPASLVFAQVKWSF